MVAGLLAANTFSRREPVAFVPSRCLRMRYRKSSCAKCREQCRFDALGTGKRITIDQEKCSGCMLCTACCPTDALAFSQHDFEKTVSGLAASSLVVIACKRRSLFGAHISLPCLGALSEHHLLALLAITTGRISIDLGPCVACENAFVADVLQERFSLAVEPFLSPEARARVGFLHGHNNREGLSGLAERRSFFAALGLFVLRQTGQCSPDRRQPARYAEKHLPPKMRLLGHALAAAPSETIRTGIRRKYLYCLAVRGSCDFCGGCAGMCPTGALMSKNTGGRKELLFAADRCCGCRLCEEFCKKKALSLAKAGAAPQQGAAG